MNVQAKTKAAPEAIIAEAFAASEHAGKEQFRLDGSEDMGTCGGYILKIDGRSPVAHELIARGQGSKSVTGGVHVRFPDGDCPSQHMAIREKAGEAACAVFERHGVRVIEARSYID